MGLRYMTGFEEYSTGRGSWYFSAINNSVYTPHSLFKIDSGRFSGNALTYDTGSTNIAFPLPVGPSADFIIGFAYKFDSGGKSSRIVSMDRFFPDQTIWNSQSLVLTADDTLNVEINGTTVVRGHIGLLPGRYYYIEWSFSSMLYAQSNVHRTPQTEIRIDGVVDSKLTNPTIIETYTRGDDYYASNIGGHNTYPVGTKYGILGLFRFWADHAFLQQWWDDVYIIDNQLLYNPTTQDNGLVTYDYPSTEPVATDFLGDVKIGIIQVDDGQTGSKNQWDVVGTMNRATALKELEPDGDTSYVSTASRGAKQLVKFQTIRTDTEDIRAVGLVSQVAASTELAQGYQRYAYQIGTEDGFIVDEPPNDAEPNARLGPHGSGPYQTVYPYFPNSRIWSKDINSNGNWTPEKINTLEAGFKVTV